MISLSRSSGRSRSLKGLLLGSTGIVALCLPLSLLDDLTSGDLELSAMLSCDLSSEGLDSTEHCEASSPGDFEISFEATSGSDGAVVFEEISSESMELVCFAHQGCYWPNISLPPL